MSFRWDNGIADRIQIFTVAFMVPQKVKDLLASCGTTPSNAYQPNSMAQLVADFGHGRQGDELATRLTNW